MGIPTANYREIDESTVPPVQLAGAHAVITPTLFGPDDKPYKITTVDDFKAMFGGPDTIKAPFFAQIRRALSRGTVLYIQRLLATGATAASHVFVNEKVTVTAKDKGSWANATLGLDYTPVTNGVCMLRVRYAPNTTLEEVFTADTFDNLMTKVNENSVRIGITVAAGYSEPAATETTVFLANGNDGVFANDAAKDTAVNALFTNFNNLTGLDSISCLGHYTANHLENITAYAEGRGDLMALFEIDPADTYNQAKTFMDAVTKKSSFLAIYYGSKLSAYSVEAQGDVDGPILMDVLAVWSYNDTVASRRKAPAGAKRGLIPNVKSFSNNLLSPARKSEADALADLGVNIVGEHPAFGPVVWGAATRNMNNSALDAIHVRRMLIDLSLTLMPIYQSTLFDPMDPITWRQAYGQAKPILEDLVAERAIYAYQYIGDQDSSKIQDARYNKPTDLANGIYKVKIPMVPVGYIKQIDFTVQVNNLLTLFQTTAQ